MTFKKSINSARGKIMRSITRNVGASHVDEKGDVTHPVEIKKILICRPNHRLGNQLLMTPLVQDLIDMFPDCEIDLFVKGGLAPIIFKNYTNIHAFIPLPKKVVKQFATYIKGWKTITARRYDLVINTVSNSSSGRLSTKFANARYRFFGDDVPELAAKHKDHGHMAKNVVYNLRHYLTRLGYPASQKPVPFLDLKLAPAELANGRKLVWDLVQNDKPTICLYTYATGAKCYSPEWWGNFYERLKTVYRTTYNIIEMLPVENVSQIAFKAPSFYSKDVREMGAMIAHTSVFIGADSGIMHLASAALTPTVGLFSVTDIAPYEPYNPGSIAIDTKTSGLDDWMREIGRILGRGVEETGGRS